MKIGASERFFILFPTIFLFPKIESHISTSHVHIIIFLFRPESRKIPVFYYSLLHAFRIDRFHVRICMHRNKKIVGAPPKIGGRVLENQR